MVASVLILTSKNDADLSNVFEKAQMISDTGKNVRILLFGDAVLETCKQNFNRPSQIDLYVCKEDLESRGLAQKVNAIFKTVDYDGIVELLMKNDDHIVNYV
ncbi:MAG: hypothetical protein JRN20_12245 [Nitrososphaerota archaeon]|jgi:sulfur relay protein TusB/DsrH|nr:hypothetical protein [Nitrososphaerota archaeon]MDG6921985.1 hypothetical protein [Nitrososphaerota archaeon]